MNRSTKVVLLTSIMVMIIAVSAVSYAYIKTYSTQSTTNTISTLECLGVTMGNQSEYIEMNNAYPISDAEGLANATPYTFTVTNNCETPVSVQINLERLQQSITNTLGLDKIKIAFYRTGLTGYSAGLLSAKSDGTKVYSSSESSKILMYVVLANHESRSYTLRMWLTEGADSSDMGKVYKGKIAMVVTPMVYTARALSGWNASSGTLLDAIENGKYIFASNMTTPGRAVATSAAEGIISSTADDYGTSYYFRGRIDDNYVVFANMCWKIVRITGSDGTNGEYNNAIKLILHNYNPDNLANPCSQYKNGAAFALGYDSTTNGLAGKSAFNSTRDSNAYIGYMFGTRRSSTYVAEHANTNPSTIFTNIKKWYDLKLTSYASYLADVIWCNDKSVNSGTGIGNTSTTYKANTRNNSTSTAAPSLICPDASTDDVNNKNLSRLTSSTSTDGGYGNGALAGYKIGLITADEVAFAGGTIGDNKVYYLYEGANNMSWWTMSPGNYGNAKLYSVQTTGKLSIIEAHNVYGIRPMIALKNDVTVNSGSDGTAANPYVITGRLGA